jgi:class 3 adenylate cyclase
MRLRLPAAAAVPPVGLDGEVRGHDIGGIGVHIGARVSALAGPNDVLVSSTLRDLVIGSGLQFDEHGAYEFKGVPGEWRLFAVASS